VGKLPLPTDQVELITLALIYKFMDDLDGESVQMGGKRSFFTGELAKYRWSALLPQTVSAEERVTLFSEGIEALGNPNKAAHLPGLFRDVFRNAFLKFRDGRILTMFLTEVNAFAYSHSEELGNAFEYLLQCMGTQGENGQFRTPRHIIDFIVACLDPQPGERILDPACGTGGFLVSAYKHMLAAHTSAGSSIPGDRLTHEKRQQVYANLTGYDITDLMVKLSKVNLFLHGFPDPAIHIYDTLSNDARWNEKADLILANPPFMTPKGGVTPHTKFRIAAKKAEVLFTDYIAEHLSSTGRGGVIVPNGIVATTQNAYIKLRRFLVEDCLVAVVSLPSGVFKPYSGVKTSILFFDKQLARKTKEVLFLKITADGFDLGDQRREIEANDLPEAERLVKAWFAGQMAGAEGAGFRAKGPSSFQPGPTAQEPGTKTRQGLKARAMPAAVPLVHGSGLQPSAVTTDDTPGALPQAGMGSAVGAGVVWKRVEKTTVLETKDATLVAERFLGVAENDSEHHPMIALGDDELFRLESGSTPSTTKPEYWDGPHAWATLVDLPAEDLVTNLTRTERTITVAGLKNSSAVLLPIGTVIVSTRATLGRVAVARIPVATNQGFKNIIIKDAARALPEYVALAVTRLRAQMLEFASGGTFKEISKSNFALLEIPLPPLEEQRRIVAEIEGYQKVLDGARQILAGYQPDLQVDPDWEMKPLGEIAEVKLGKMLDKNKHTSGRLMPYLRNVNVRWNSIETHDLLEMYYDEDELDRFGLKAGDVLVCEGGEPGRSAVWDGHLPDLKYQKALHRVRFKVPYEPKLLVYYLQALSQTKEWEDRFHGATIKHFTREMFIELPIPLPPLEEQRRIVSELDAEAAQMAAVRSLIPRFEGKIQRVLDRLWGTAVAE